MNVMYLVLLVLLLSLCVGLALFNPTMDEYLGFVEAELGKALDRGDQSQPGQERAKERAMVRSIFRSHSHELVGSIVGPHTVRKNWGLMSVYETTVLDSHILVLGVAGRFIPLRGIDEAILRLGRLAF
ncbi:MAG TPA: DUF4359 domain-containing protein [Nitrospira sp.]